MFAGAKHGFGPHNDGALVAACILLLVGAFAKSAQIPLHTWLPDAMEGPTPVSALIHAATMVTAGVYLIARTHPLFEQAPAAAEVAAIGGTITLLVAASIAMVQTDLKRVIAYSTMSQIGYMVLGVSVFAYSAGMFHLMTHAFFKALLFMAAGSVISAMGGEQNMDRMGGFRRAMPFTFVCFTVGALALAGFFPFSGLFSKDEILAYCFQRGGIDAVLGVLGYVGSLLTAFYAFRMVFRTFFGETSPEAEQLMRGELAHGDHRNPATGEEEDTDVGFPGPEHHIAEREAPMKLGMAPLALLALTGGALGIPGVSTRGRALPRPELRRLASYAGQAPADSKQWVGLAVGAVLAVIGILVAYELYERRSGYTLRLRDRMRGAARLPLQQVVLRRALRRRLRAPRRGRRALRPQRRREPPGAGPADRRRRRRRARGHVVRARHPDRLPAGLRAAAADGPRRPRPLLPAGELVSALTVAIFLPAVLGVATALVPRPLVRFVAAGGSLAVLAYAIGLIADYPHSGGGLHYVTDKMWISELGIHYSIGVDGLSLFLIAMTALLWVHLDGCRRAARVGPAALLLLQPRPRGDGGAGRVLRAGRRAVRLLLRPDARAVLLPDRHLGRAPPRRGDHQVRDLHARRLAADAGGGGGARRALDATPAATSPSTSRTSRGTTLSRGSQEWIFLLFALAFLVKMPAFPLHGWMPDAYRATPVPVLILLSAVLSKVGAYGFLRIVIPLMPDAASHFQELMIVVAIVSILYGSILAFSQDDARLVVGYSSVAQLGFITLGIFSLDPKGAQGAVFQMVNHALVVAPLFLIIGALALRAGGTNSLARLGGMALRAPVLAALFLIVALATLAMPGSGNFVGELYILFGTFSHKLAYGIVATAGVALAAVYMIRMYQRAMHNRAGPEVESRDLTRFELGLLAPLVVVIVALGLYPQFLLSRSQAATDSKLPTRPVTGAYIQAKGGPGGGRPVAGAAVPNPSQLGAGK